MYTGGEKRWIVVVFFLRNVQEFVTYGKTLHEVTYDTPFLWTNDTFFSGDVRP